MVSETKKGRTRREFTPLSLIPERLPRRIDAFRLPARCPIGGRFAGSAALQSSLHERSFCLSVSGWIAPSAATLSPSPIRDATITRRGLGSQGNRRWRRSSRCSERASPGGAQPFNCASGGGIRGLQETCLAAAAGSPSAARPLPRGCTSQGLQGARCSRGQQSLASRERGGRPGAGGPCVGCRFFLHLSYLERFVNY